MSRPTIIGLAGPARAGKDTIARVIQQNMPQHTVIVEKWASALKRIVADVFDLTWEQVNGDDPGFDREAPFSPTGLSIRQALQELGTEWGRKFDPDVWVKKTLRDIQNRAEGQSWPPIEFAFVTDTRFKNEAAACDVVVWVERPGLERIELSDHVSETSLTPIDADYILDNNGPVSLLNVAGHELVLWLRQQRRLAQPQ